MQVMGYYDTKALYVPLSDVLSGTSWFNAWVNQSNTALVILLICLGLLPFALASICEAIFQGRERMTFIAYVNGPANIIRIVLIFLLTTGGAGLYAIATMMFISHFCVMVAEWFFMLKHIIVPKLRFSFSFAMMLVRQSLTFLGIDAVIAVISSLYLVLLSRYINESAVGLYSSATQLVTPLLILYQSIVLSVFPIMCQRFDPKNPLGLKKISTNLLELLLILAIPMTIGIMFFAEWGLVFVYGKDQFALAGEAVRLTALVVLMQAITSVFGRVLVASLKEKVTLRIVIVNLTLSFILGSVLIPQYGVLGAAMASFFTMIVDLAQHYVPVSRMLQGVPLIKLAWRPTLAAGVMAGFLYVAQGQNEILSIGLAILVYFGTLGLLLVATIGGPRQIRAKYLGAPS
jgi:O-antigen/teichoic acid export membrane protein